jgi:hypothetical protein
VETGNRGNGLRVMKLGNKSRRARNSGLERSGDVHIRRYSSEESKIFLSVRVRGCISSPGMVVELGGTSAESVVSKAALFPEEFEDEGAMVRERDGVSMNGSLGARLRLACPVGDNGTEGGLI